MSDKDTVTVRRRRRGDSSGTEGRERAQAPKRRQPSSGGPSTPPGGTGQPPPRRPTATGGGLFTGGGSPRRLSTGGLVLVIIIFLIYMWISNSGEPNGGGEQFTVPTADSGVVSQPDRPTATAAPIFQPPAASDGTTWLVMLYQDADDKVLEQDIYLDLNEAERVGSTNRVHIVAQVDRYQAGYQGDGNWTSAKRYYITQDDDLSRVRSQLVQDLGEVNMADGNTLVDFVTWAIETFPADRHILILSDHGMGWPGGWSDSDPGRRGDRSIPLASRLGDELYLMEIDQALGEIRNRTGIEKLEMVGMDACLMGHLEVYSALAPHAHYAVASQETEPALGWAYTGFLTSLLQNPDMDGAELGRQIVASYIQNDQRIVDEQARAEFLKQGSPMGGLFSLFGSVTADQLVQQMERNITLAAVDLGKLPELQGSVNELSFELQGENQPDVARARNFAQAFTSVFGKEVPPSYIDLGSFVQLLKRESSSQAVRQAADRVLSSLQNFVLAEKHGPDKPGATGVSIYFPNSQLYSNPITGPESYLAIASRFAADSLWDDFLGFHYTSQPFKAQVAQPALPEPGRSVRAPGLGVIEISPVSLSNDVAAPGRPVVLSSDIRGENIGYAYLFVGFYDSASNSIFVADTDYLETDTTREVEGVYYPDWGARTDFTLQFEWEPVVFAISDGVNTVPTMLNPESYGISFEEAIYSLDGIYTYADGSESRYARLYFSNGVLRQVFGFTGEAGTGAPREIIPSQGDSFTILETWLDLDASGNVIQEATQEGSTLIFGDQMFTWEEMDAAIGEYIVGFIVEDLDGNRYEAYTSVSVQ